MDASVRSAGRLTLTHELVICTKDRPDEMEQCLSAVARSEPLPGRVTVVDSSGDVRTRSVVERFGDAFAAGGVDLVYRHTSPGLPAQRNTGLDLTTADVVHFVDDDVIVHRDYFGRVVSTFRDHPEAVGVGGFMVNTTARRDPSRIGRAFLLSAPHGQFNKAACNNPLRADTRGTVDVGWLRGSAMSFRRPLATALRFDESLTGYALGEDLEFSVRAGRHGRLLVDTSARIDHARSERNRLDQSQLRRSDLVHRWHFVTKHPTEFSRTAYWWSVLGLTLRALARTVGEPRGDGPRELRGIRDGVLAIGSRRSPHRLR